MNENSNIANHFADVETSREHKGYFHSVGEALTIVVLGTLCGLKNVCQISQWADSERVRGLLAERFGIKKVPCYYWLLCLLKLVEPRSLNRCLARWTQSLLPEGTEGMTISFDGKTIRSTGRMDRYESPMHIVSAHVADAGLTLAGLKVDGKSNEIPAVRELISLLEVEGCMIVADAMHCQKETAELIVGKKADCLLNAKDNQPTLKKGIREYVGDDVLRKTGWLWRFSGRSRRTGAGLRPAPGSSPMRWAGWPGPDGKTFRARGRYAASSSARAKRATSGIATFPAGNLARRNCCGTPASNGRWSRCAGFWTRISARTSAASRTRTRSGR